jgi:AraC-like DNA-binding protein
MKPLFNLMPVLLLFGAAQGVFLALVLARMKRGHRTANRFLAGILFIFSIDLVGAFLSVTYAFTRFPGLIGINWPLLFLYGPLLYFYVKSLTVPQWRIDRLKLSAHFIPTILMYIYLIPVFLLDPETKAQAWFAENSHLKNYTNLVDPILYVAIIQIAGYLVLSLRLLGFHSRNIRQNFSSLEDISLSWLRGLIFGFFFLLCMFTFSAVFSQFYGVYKQAEYLLNFMIALCIYIMAYKGITQPDIFGPLEKACVPGPECPALPNDGGSKATAAIIEAPGPRIAVSAPESLPLPESAISNDRGEDRADAPPDTLPPDETGLTEKYKRSALTEEQTDKILARLINVMEKEKPFLEMGLTLPTLSNMLDVSPHHLSQVINGRLKKSFFDLVNEYRVQEAKRALVSPESRQFNILGIAMDVGFNSKSAFYTAFKKHTGMTPSRFKESRTSRDGSPGPA